MKTSTKNALRSLSLQLAPLRALFRAQGFSTVYLGGSSAREILDSILFDAPLSLRDLDLYLIKGATVFPEDVQVLCRALQARNIARMDAAPLRTKLRGNPALQGSARYQYIAGYGAHLFFPGRPIVSLSILHSRRDLALNGLLDIDTTLLCLAHQSSFAVFADQVHRVAHPHIPRGTPWVLDHTWQSLQTMKYVCDPHRGYLAWRARSPNVVHWTEVERCFTRHAFRLVRSMAKVSCFHLSKPWIEAYHSHRPSQHSPHLSRELCRDLAKVLADPAWRRELGMLGQLGALKQLAPALHRSICAPQPLVSPDFGAIGSDPHERVGKRDLARHRARALLVHAGDVQTKNLLHRTLEVIPSVFEAPQCLAPRIGLHKSRAQRSSSSQSAVLKYC